MCIDCVHFKAIVIIHVLNLPKWIICVSACAERIQAYAQSLFKQKRTACSSAVRKPYCTSSKQLGTQNTSNEACRKKRILSPRVKHKLFIKQFKTFRRKSTLEWPVHVDFTTKIFPIIWREAFLRGSRSYYSDFFYIKYVVTKRSRNVNVCVLEIRIQIKILSRTNSFKQIVCASISTVWTEQTKN